MKKLLSSLIIVCVLTASLWGLESNSCKSCVSGHTEISESCHSNKSASTKKMECHTQDASSSCAMTDKKTNDCEMCSHGTSTPILSEVSAPVVIEKDLLISLKSYTKMLANVVNSSYKMNHWLQSSLIQSNNLAFLESIRLII